MSTNYYYYPRDDLEFKAVVRDPERRNLNLREVSGCRHASEWKDGVAHVYGTMINQRQIKAKLVRLRIEWEPRDLVQRDDA